MTIESSGQLLQDEVVFHVGTDSVMRISAKKSVLSRNNDVFNAMFYGPLSRDNFRSHQPKTVENDTVATTEASTTSANNIYDPDVDGRAFKNLIR